jgi:hypothetical protein
MKYFFYMVVAVQLFAIQTVAGVQYTGYMALDQTEPVTFDGEKVTWSGQTWELGDRTIFIDYRLNEAQIADHPMVRIVKQ